MAEDKSAFSLLDDPDQPAAAPTAKPKGETDYSYERKEVLLKIENLCLNIDGKVILKDVNAEVCNITRPGMEQGQVIGFLGPSGIGKTQLFELMSGLKQPTSGQVLIGNPLKPVKVGQVGVVQQSYPLFNHRTVFGNLDIALKKGMQYGLKNRFADMRDFFKDTLHHMEKRSLASVETRSARLARKDKIMDVLEKFDLTDHKTKYPAQLSGGQKQRVAIAQQLLCSDEYLLLDEPFSGLDMVMIAKVQDMLREISCIDELRTIIIVSHDVVSTASIADTLWVMGRDRDAKGNPIPGSKIKYQYDLMERNLAWHKEIEDTKEFRDLVKEVKAVFPTL